MNVSDLCSDLPSESSSRSEINHKLVSDKPEIGLTQAKQPQTIKDKSTHLHDNLKLFKTMHKTFNSEEQEKMIDDLCVLAGILCESIDEASVNIRKREYPETDEEEDEDHQNYINKKQDYELIRHARNSQGPYRYHRRSKRTMVGHKCHSCGTMETPEWRRGPDGARTLCNACGLHYSKLLRKGAIGAQIGSHLLKNRAQLSGSSTITNNDEKLSFPENYPFILIDPKYGFNKRMDSLAPPSSLSTAHPHSMDRNQLKFIDNYASPAFDEAVKPKDNENSNAPLKIYQWKQ